MNMKKRIITPHTPSRARSFVPKPTSEARSFSNFPLGNKKAANFGIALLVIGLIITATAAVFYFSGEKKTAEVPSQPKKLSIEELKLCNNVDENFACNENVDGAFKIGSRF